MGVKFGDKVKTPDGLTGVVYLTEGDYAFVQGTLPPSPGQPKEVSYAVRCPVDELTVLETSVPFGESFKDFVPPEPWVGREALRRARETTERQWRAAVRAEEASPVQLKPPAPPDARYEYSVAVPGQTFRILYEAGWIDLEGRMTVQGDFAFKSMIAVEVRVSPEPDPKQVEEGQRAWAEQYQREWAERLCAQPDHVIDGPPGRGKP